MVIVFAILRLTLVLALQQKNYLAKWKLDGDVKRSKTGITNRTYLHRGCLLDKPKHLTSKHTSFMPWQTTRRKFVCSERRIRILLSPCVLYFLTSSSTHTNLHTGRTRAPNEQGSVLQNQPKSLCTTAGCHRAAASSHPLYSHEM